MLLIDIIGNPRHYAVRFLGIQDNFIFISKNNILGYSIISIDINDIDAIYLGIGKTFPYFDGGTSISSTARYYPLYLIFKPMMFDLSNTIPHSKYMIKDSIFLKKGLKIILVDIFSIYILYKKSTNKLRV